MDVACVAIPRLSLLAACEGRRELLRAPAALAPGPGGGAVGEASAAAEARGVRPGMRLGEALARCPELRLVAPDPGAAAELWEGALRGLEGIGAAVESERPGEAFFVVDGLRGIHGGEVGGVVAAARAAVEVPIRVAVAPTRFAAYVAARGEAAGRAAAGSGPETVVPPARLRAFLAPLPVATLFPRLGVPERQGADLVAALERLGVRTLGGLARLLPGQVADRFGALGLRALRLARGEDTPLRPRRPHEELAAELELPEGAAGLQLDRALELLIDRLLAAPRRRDRTVLEVRLSARLCGGGSWSISQGLGRPTASAGVLRTVLAPRLEALPGPAASLRLRALSLGPPVGDQLELSLDGAVPRHGRLGEAVRQIRATQGPEALLKVLPVDAASRVPERRAMLTPFPEP